MPNNQEKIRELLTPILTLLEWQTDKVMAKTENIKFFLSESPLV